MAALQVDRVVKAFGDKPTLKSFIEQFGVFAQGPSGVAQLKSLVYQLAISGRLLAIDEHLNVKTFLEKLYKEKKYLITQKKAKKSKLDRKNIQPPFELPSNWVWEHLDYLSQDIHYGYTASADPSIDEVRLLRITDIQNDRVDWASVPGCKIDEKKYQSNSLEDNDLLIARTGGTVGKTYLVENLSVNSVFASYLIRFKPLKTTWAPYIKLFTLTPLYWNQLVDKTSGSAQPNINATSLKEMLVPVPPLEEQKRIVSKVDELMALCDQLEAQQQQQANTLLKANTAAIHALLSTGADQATKQKAGTQAPQNKKQKDFEVAWKRIDNNFHTLYGNTLPIPPGEGRKKKYFVGLVNLKQLRQMIIELAMKGDLSSFSPEDGSAVVQLERIRSERNRRIEIGDIKKKKLPQLDNYNLYPSHWARVRLLELTEVITKGSSPKWQGVEYVEGGYNSVLFITSENVSNYVLNLTKKKFVEEKFNEIEPRSILKEGDLLTNIVGASIGRTAEFDLEVIANINQAVCIIRLLPDSIDKKFMLHFFNSDYCLKMMFENQVENARANLSMGNIEKFIIPFPPLEEQKRIAAKVDQLMAFCDQLEQQLTTAYWDAEKLINATIKRLVV